MEHKVGVWENAKKKATVKSKRKAESSSTGAAAAAVAAGADAGAGDAVVVLPANEMPIPPTLSTLIEKVLAGDTDAVGLLGTRASELLNLDGGGGGASSSTNRSNYNPSSASAGAGATAMPPTAIRAEFYSYTFSDWEGLSTRGEWWARQRMSTPRVFEASSSAADGGAKDGTEKDGGDRGGSRVPTRRSPWQRHWLLFAAAAGVWHTATAMAWLPSKSWRLVSALFFLVCFWTALMKDYPDHHLANVPQLLKAWTPDVVQSMASRQYYGDIVMGGCTYLALASTTVLLLAWKRLQEGEEGGTTTVLANTACAPTLFLACVIVVLASEAGVLQAQLDLLP